MVVLAANVISLALPSLIDMELINCGGGAMCGFGPGSPGKFPFSPRVPCPTCSGLASVPRVLRDCVQSLLPQYHKESLSFKIKVCNYTNFVDL